MFLYNKVAFLKFKAEEIATQIKMKYRYSENQELPKQLASMLKDWRVTERDSTAEIQIIERKVTLSEKKNAGSIPFFLSQVQKNADRVLGAIYRNKPVFITGDQVLVDLLLELIGILDGIHTVPTPAGPIPKFNVAQTTTGPLAKAFADIKRKVKDILSEQNFTV